MDNTQNGAIEPRKVSTVDLRQIGFATIYCTDGTNSHLPMEEYRDLLASGQINVDEAQFLTNVHNAPETTELPAMPDAISIPGEIVINESKPDKPVKLTAKPRWDRITVFAIVAFALTTMFLFHPLLALGVIVIMALLSVPSKS